MGSSELGADDFLLGLLLVYPILVDPAPHFSFNDLQSYALLTPFILPQTPETPPSSATSLTLLHFTQPRLLTTYVLPSPPLLFDIFYVLPSPSIHFGFFYEPPSPPILFRTLYILPSYPLLCRTIYTSSSPPTIFASSSCFPRLLHSSLPSTHFPHPYSFYGSVPLQTPTSRPSLNV